MNKLSKLRTLIPLESLEESAKQQIYDALELDVVEALAIMPDCHTGYSLPIGGVALTKGCISPDYVGYDIGCGMFCYITDLDASKFEASREEIYHEITRSIPTGFFAHKKLKNEMAFEPACGDKGLKNKVQDKANIQLGTLGGGNHFIEIGSTRKGMLAIVIHSGSRKSGWLIAQYYMKASKAKNGLPKGFLRLDEELGQAYVKDMEWALKYAYRNREIMAEEILRILGLKDEGMVFVNENHNTAKMVDDIRVIHRKGATPAELHQWGIIPGNMRDGTFVTKGLGNEEFLCSASHGAGRRFSRKAAKEAFTLDDLKKDMEGITTKLHESMVDEIPEAYKDVNEVIAMQDGIVVKVIDHITPMINLKG